MLGGFSTPIKNNYVDDQVPETINIHRIVSDDSLLSDKVKAEESDHSFEVNVARRPMILTSQYLGRPPTLFFQYPPVHQTNLHIKSDMRVEAIIIACPIHGCT